jgi:hypothetical protein
MRQKDHVQAEKYREGLQDQGRVHVPVATARPEFRRSVGTIEALQGLNLADPIILSDISQWDAYDRVTLN